MLTGLCLPIGLFLLKQCQEYCFIEESRSFLDAKYRSKLRWNRKFTSMLTSVLPMVLRPFSSYALGEVEKIRQASKSTDPEQATQDSDSSNPMQNDLTPSSHTVEAVDFTSGMLAIDPSQLFLKESFVIRTVGDIAVLITFGAVFPPLALVTCLAIIGTTVKDQLLIGRFIRLAESQHYLLPYIKIITKQCFGLSKCYPFLSPCSFFLMRLHLFYRQIV